MVGQDTQRGEHESAVQRPDRKGRAALAEELFEPLQLSFVVTQDDRRHRAQGELPQPLQIALDRLRRREREPLVGFSHAHRHATERLDAGVPVLWIDEQLFARRRIFAQTPRHIQVVRRIRPRALHLQLHSGFLIHHQYRVGRQELQERRTNAPHSMSFRVPRPRFLGLYGQHGDSFDRFPGALRVEIECT